MTILWPDNLFYSVFRDPSLSASQGLILHDTLPDSASSALNRPQRGHHLKHHSDLPHGPLASSSHHNGSGCKHSPSCFDCPKPDCSWPL